MQGLEASLDWSPIRTQSGMQVKGLIELTFVRMPFITAGLHLPIVALSWCIFETQKNILCIKYALAYRDLLHRVKTTEEPTTNQSWEISQITLQASTIQRIALNLRGFQNTSFQTQKSFAKLTHNKNKASRASIKFSRSVVI